MRLRRVILWLGLVLLLLALLAIAGAVVVTKWGEQAYSSGMGTIVPSAATACSLLPPDMDFFAQDNDFPEHWRAFRKSDVYGSITGISTFRDILDTWKLGDREISAFETWV